MARAAKASGEEHHVVATVRAMAPTAPVPVVGNRVATGMSTAPASALPGPLPATASSPFVDTDPAVPSSASLLVPLPVTLPNGLGVAAALAGSCVACGNAACVAAMVLEKRGWGARYG